MRKPALAALLLALALPAAAAEPVATDAPAFCPPEEAASAAPVVDPRANFFVHGARTGDLAAVRKALADQQPIDAVDSLDQTALIAAISQNKLEVVQYLLGHGANANHVDGAGWSPLHFAVYFATDTALLDALLKAGAKINAQNDRGITPLYFASIAGHEQQVKRLLAAGADRNLASKNGYTPLKVARIKGLQGTAALLTSGS